MGVFDDKKFEGLDWISQATEPIDSRLNEILGQIPEVIYIDFHTYKKIVGERYCIDLSLDRAINFAMKEYCETPLSWSEEGYITPCFQFKMDDGIDIDFENEIITGSLWLIKIQSTMDEKILEGLLGREGIEAVQSMFFTGTGLSRANEIMELLGQCEEGLKTRSERKKRQVLRVRLLKLFKDNEWKIKDTELANKVGRWIRNYVVDGDLASLSNFCRLKVMTHKDQPIYSMEEVK